MTRFRYLDSVHPIQELSGSLSYILCVTIYISLRDIPNYTIRQVIVYHYCFLFSKAYRNRYQVIEIGPGVPGSISRVVDLEVLGPGSWVPGPESQVLGPHFRLQFQTALQAAWIKVTLCALHNFSGYTWYNISLLSTKRHFYNFSNSPLLTFSFTSYLKKFLMIAMFLLSINFDEQVHDLEITRVIRLREKQSQSLRD